MSEVHFPVDETQMIHCTAVNEQAVYTLFGVQYFVQSEREQGLEHSHRNNTQGS